MESVTQAYLLGCTILGSKSKGQGSEAMRKFLNKNHLQLFYKTTWQYLLNLNTILLISILPGNMYAYVTKKHI